MAGSDATVLVIWETMIRHGSLGMGMIGFGTRGLALLMFPTEDGWVVDLCGWTSSDGGEE